MLGLGILSPVVFEPQRSETSFRSEIPALRVFDHRFVAYPSFFVPNFAVSTEERRNMGVFDWSLYVVGFWSLCRLQRRNIGVWFRPTPPCGLGGRAILSTERLETFRINRNGLHQASVTVTRGPALTASPKSAEGRGKGGFSDATWDDTKRFHA